MTDTSFCTRCGQRVSEEALYCPACGAPIEGRVDPGTGMTSQQILEDRMDDSRMNFIKVLLLIYGLPVLVIGFYLMLRIDQMTAIFVADDMVKEAMTQ